MLKTAMLSGALLACVWLTACDKKSSEPPPEPLAPPLSVLELPVSLRTSDAAPSDACKVELGMSDVRVDDQLVLKLDQGKVRAADQADGVLPKLLTALQTKARSRIAIGTHASLPYETAALVLNSASRADVQQVTFRVRKAGAATDTGWLAVDFQMTPRTDDEVVLRNVDSLGWDDFTKVWPTMHDACRTSQTGNCPYVESNVAKGGKLKLVLFASGSGVNLDFFRVGLTPGELAAEEQKRKSELANHKEGFIQGRVAKSDLEKELTEGDPASQALFQFRAREATDSPSVVTAVMQPLCGKKACGAVVSADSNTLMVRVVSLIGAAFADGSAPPVLAFEMPWTKKPKAQPAAAPAK